MKIQKNNKTIAYVLATTILLAGGTVTAKEMHEKNEVIAKLQEENTKLVDKVQINFEKYEAATGEISKLNTNLQEREETLRRINHEKQTITTEKAKLNDKVQRLEKEKKTLLAETKAKAVHVDTQIASASTGGSWKPFVSTAYVSFCDTGCTGITATGKDVRNNIYENGMRVIAVDPKVIPLHSIVELDIDGKREKAIALDKGGAIKGNKIDYLIAVNDTNKAFEYGKKQIKVRVLRNGKG